MNQTLQNDIDAIVSQLVANYKPEKIILFGSAARGDMHDDSDLDLFVIKKTDAPFFARVPVAHRLLHIRRSVDIVVYTPEELKKAQEDKRLFIRNVLQYGQTLYDQTTQPS